VEGLGLESEWGRDSRDLCWTCWVTAQGMDMSSYSSYLGRYMRERISSMEDCGLYLLDHMYHQTSSMIDAHRVHITSYASERTSLIDAYGGGT
jgi:hypothetical protein